MQVGDRSVTTARRHPGGELILSYLSEIDGLDRIGDALQLDILTCFSLFLIVQRVWLPRLGRQRSARSRGTGDCSPSWKSSVYFDILMKAERKT